jgi:hypothetical protein
MSLRAPVFALLLLALAAAPAHGQGIVVDQGQFTVTLDGRPAGVEDFVIRRAGRQGDAVFANATIRLDGPRGHQEVRPLLQAAPLDGAAMGYQVSVTGVDALELRLQRSGRRYVASIQSSIGDEDREFQARPDTRIVEQQVAHHYYFVRDAREGRPVHVLEPRTRRQLDLVAGPRVDEEIRVGRNVVQARRVEFTVDTEVRLVWYDRQGRVLRVEVPSEGYIAERSDLVG